MATKFRNGKDNRTAPLTFEQLEPDGSNYTDWNFNIPATLAADEIDSALDLHPGEEIPTPYLWQTMLVMRRHMDPTLQM